MCVTFWPIVFFTSLSHISSTSIFRCHGIVWVCSFFFLPSVESWELHQRSLNLVCRWVNLLTVCSFFPIFIVCLIFIYFFPSFVLLLPLASLLRCISLSPLPGYVCFFSFFFFFLCAALLFSIWSLGLKPFQTHSLTLEISKLKGKHQNRFGIRVFFPSFSLLWASLFLSLFSPSSCLSS